MPADKLARWNVAFANGVHQIHEIRANLAVILIRKAVTEADG